MLEQQQIERARSIDLLSYLQENEPNNLKKVSRNSYSLVDHDSLKISENGKWFWFSQGFGGFGALDYLTKVRGFGFIDAVETLTGAAIRSKTYHPTPDLKSGAPPEKRGFLLPLRNKDNLRIIAYLQSRGIDRDIITKAIENCILYESAGTHNCVFVGRDTSGKAKYAFMRGTIGSFKQEITGSDKRHGFCLPGLSEGCSAVAVFEGAVDALSMATLDKLSDNSHDRHYLSLGGTSPLALDQFLSDHPETTSVILCLDNDAPGIEASEKLLLYLKKRGIATTSKPPEKHNDWNDALLTALRQPHQNSRRKAVQSIQRREIT